MEAIMRKENTMDANEIDIAGNLNPIALRETTAAERIRILKSASRKIHPRDAEVQFIYSELDDPEGVLPSVGSKHYHLAKGKIWFARSMVGGALPKKTIWVSFKDLPEWKREALWDQVARYADPHLVDGMPIEEWIAIRKAETKLIDPETALLVLQYFNHSDPYALGIVCDDDDEPYYNYGWFVRRPGSGIWVYFGDLPQSVQDRLEERVRNGEFAGQYL
jgi:hypothetical protein